MDYRGTPANLRADWHLTRDWELFQSVESGASDHLFRIWDVPDPVVVAGRSNRLEDWVQLDACRRDNVPVLRRFSGGGAVVLAPGCLNYAVATSLVSRPELADVGSSLCFVLQHIVAAFGLTGLAISAPSDLSLDGLKVSGNAQRRGRRAMLQHGTILHAFDATLAARYLAPPPREPAYRQRRSHEAFMGNVPLPEGIVRERLTAALAATHSSFQDVCR
jgi:lipoate-protein ligase A